AGSATIIAGILSFIILPSIKPVIKEHVKGENLFQQMARSFKTSYFVLLIVVFVFSFGISNFQSTLTMFLTYKFNYTPNDIAIVMTVGGFFGVIVQGFALNKLFETFGEMKIILIGLVAAALSLYGMLYVSGFFIIILVATIFSTATTLIRPAVNTLISRTAGDEQGYAAGMNNSYMSLGNMIGPALAGTLFDWHRNIPFTFGSIILIGCFFLTFVWTKKKKSAAQHA
ncbi:MAG TPA: MFS transporter, partial [Neobacillus sp.]